ncbi:FadR family transcriptional regulator [Pseudomonas sp. ZM23]|uniref:FadR/GntR family transcriptional regulator n=1 Tax=Pseudomonas triclosanedens TaxID=2961893 RepID=A0ABY7A5L8_9PSED|nr:FadR/GntR family transcriptional regulator [Pseudomonas triclosanedens]MCP8465819.1 FadR family transcriptional regulator [Pseudomonas triclosanedens]MCP8471314.1 FadR family transcriptional regulator [Pseudomonas triclosanedens]MCP8477118.1 FadR family transcriptional regulator [Pseudomonas triclosanedens]WAI51776.1 FadR/GntR family transcriptional regulator [Pseudomonas triclosanedens]
MPSPIQKRSLVDIALEQIRIRIDEGTWPLGKRLPPEPELAETLGMSRNTVREAVRVLTFSGVLEVRQGDGTYVRACANPLDTMLVLARSSVEQALEARGIIEVEASRLAAQRRSEADILALRAALEASAVRHGGALDDYIEHDLIFHQRVVDSAHNPVLSELYRYFSQVIRAGLERTIGDPGRPQPSFELHRELLDAIERGDADAAASANRALLI